MIQQRNIDKIILYFAYKYKGNWEEIYKAIKFKEKIHQENLNEISKYKKNYITIFSDNYPENLKKMKNPPFILFYKGNIKLLEQEKIFLYAKSINKKYEIFRLINFFLLKNIKILILEDLIDDTKILSLLFYKEIILLKSTGINSNLITASILEEEILNHNGLIISELPNFEIHNYHSSLRSENIKKNLSDSLFIFNYLKKDKDEIKILTKEYLNNKKNILSKKL